MLGYLSLDIVCSSKLTVFLELRSRKTARFSEQIKAADKYPSIFSRQMKAIFYVLLSTLIFANCWREPIILNLVLAMVPGRSYTLFTLDQRVIKLYNTTKNAQNCFAGITDLHLPVELQRTATRSPFALITVQVKYLFGVAIETERTTLGKIIQCFT